MKIEGMPTFTAGSDKKRVEEAMVIRFTDPEKAIEHIEGINVQDKDKLTNVPYFRAKPAAWIKLKNSMKCSACGYKDHGDQWREYRFCPACGAVFVKEEFCYPYPNDKEFRCKILVIPNAKDEAMLGILDINEKYKAWRKRFEDEITQAIEKKVKEAIKKYDFDLINEMVDMWNELITDKETYKK